MAMSSSAAKDLLLPVQSTSEIAGLPSISQCLAWYRMVAGWDPRPEMTWADAFALFRMSIVRQGITARHAARQASSSTALEIGRGMSVCVRLTQDLIKRIKDGEMGPAARL